MSDPVEHVRVSGAGIYADELVCSCGLVVLDWEEHVASDRLEAPVTAQEPVRDPRESQVDWWT